MQEVKEEKEVREKESKKAGYTFCDWILMLAMLLGILLLFMYMIMSSEKMEKPAPNIGKVSEQKTARIHLVDTYKKQGVKYYVFKTDISGTAKFVLSEEDYGKHIGIGNDAVDCTVYKLFYKSPIFQKTDLLIKREYTLEKLLEEMKVLQGIEVEKNPFDDKKISVIYTNGKWFDYDEYSIFMVDSRFNKCHEIYSEFSISRYSFIGETDFTQKEVTEYQEIISWTNERIENLCERAL